MVENEKEHSVMDIIKDGLKEGLSSISNIVIAGIFPPIISGAETIMQNVEEKIIKIEKRIIKKVYSILIIGFGVIFLVLSLFFFLVEYLGWSNTLAFFSIGMIILAIGVVTHLTVFKK
jgi:hypothetical protein